MGKQQKYYAVSNGRNGFSGVLETWKETQALVNGASHVRYKSFLSREEAEQFAKAGPNHAKPSKPSGAISKPAPKRDVAPAKKQSHLTARPRSSNRFDKYSSADTDWANALRIYTDGACESNGRRGACAGVGVYFDDGDSRNVSEGLQGELQTNNRAEMTAVVRALEIVGNEDSTTATEILTDSNYVRQGLEQWLAGWKRKNWTLSNGEPVKNKDLWMELDRLSSVVGAKRPLRIRWVPGHAGVHGNEMADRLAVKGARNSR